MRAVSALRTSDIALDVDIARDLQHLRRDYGRFRASVKQLAEPQAVLLELSRGLVRH
jgi:hypothetical protein